MQRPRHWPGTFRSGKFGSPDDADSTSNSSGHPVPPTLNNDTRVVHVEQMSPILVEKQDRIKLICWRDCPALHAG